MRHLFVVDPLDRLLPDADSTIAFMREARRRDQEIAVCAVESLALGRSGRPYATVTGLEVETGEPWYRLAATAPADLDQFDVVWMRKDQPFDLNYFFATHLLSMIPPPTLVVNHAQSLREANEKLFALRFPDLSPETIVSRDPKELLAFRAELGGECVVKPLDGAGGEGVFHLTANDRNTRAILETATAHGRRYLIAQRYLPEVRAGDKRIILVEGEPAGAVLRVPSAEETRANFHAGGRAARTTLTAREREICARLRPALVEMGIIFAGIDVIGDYLTEVNVTSPTGIREIARLDGTQIEVAVLDAVTARLLAARRA